MEKQDKIISGIVALFVLIMIGLSFFVLPEISEDAYAAHGTNWLHSKKTFKPIKNELTSISPPPFRKQEIFPCTDCHDKTEDMKPAKMKKRVLKEEHRDIVLKHDEKNRWCLDCHSVQNRDRLHLANGTLVEFKDSQRLCGQCHGDKLRDWKVGVHGRRTGFWNGPKKYLLCVHCHNPHSPHFKPIKPKPAPINQKLIKLRY